MNMDNRGTFDMLNDALFAQLDKLQSIDPKDGEQMERCIEQSKAVSQLASNIIGNANTAIGLMKMRAMDEGLGKVIVSAPRMLGGGE